MAKKPAAKGVAFEYIHPQLRALALPLGELVLDDRNHNQHDQKSIDSIAASLRTYGQRKPVVAQRSDDGRLVVRAGNGTYLAAQLLGWSHVAALIVEESDASAIGFAIVDNQAAKYSTVDATLLEELLREVDFHDDPGLAVMESDLQALIEGIEVDQEPETEPTPEPEDEEEANAFGIAVTVNSRRAQKALFDELKERDYTVKTFKP